MKRRYIFAVILSTLSCIAIAAIMFLYYIIFDASPLYYILPFTSLGSGRLLPALGVLPVLISAALLFTAMLLAFKGGNGVSGFCLAAALVIYVLAKSESVLFGVQCAIMNIRMFTGSTWPTGNYGYILFTTILALTICALVFSARHKQRSVTVLISVFIPLLLFSASSLPLPLWLHFFLFK